MKARIFAICLILTSAEVLCAQTSRKPSYQDLFDAVWSTINDNFYDPSFGGVNWKAMHEKYASQAAKVKDDRAFLDVAYKMMGELHVSHLGLYPSRAPQVGIGIRTWQLDGKSVITNVAVASDAQKQGLRIGDLLLDQPGNFTGMIGTPTKVHVQGCDGRERTMEVRRENPWWPAEHPSLRWKTIDQGTGHRIGYIKTSRFDDDAAPLIDAAMEAVKDTYGLIIDLRDNSGGNISAIRLASYFVPPPQLAVALLSRAFLNKLGSAPEQLDLAKIPRVTGVFTTAGIIDTMKENGGGAAYYGEEFGERRYRGKVIILINGDTGSAAEGLAWQLKNRPSITLVGRTTAGVVLGSETFDLPGGWILTVPTHAAWGADGKRYVDQPVSPDLEVKWTRQDFSDQRDPDMAKALDLLGTAKQSGGASATTQTDLGNRLDEFMKQEETRGFSGTVLVDKAGKIILSKGYGLADRARRAPITENTVFGIGSLAKQFTAAAILKLEMRGKLGVQDLIAKYFDGVPDDKRIITIHHLLTHSSGLPREHSNDDYDPIKRDELVSRILQSKLSFAPGTKYMYSNTDYMLLAAIIEKVSGQPFERFLREALFKPAGMSQTGFVTEQQWKRDEVACGYEGSYKGSPLDEPIVPGSWFRRGPGGMLSTAPDLRRWHLALKGDEILSIEAKKKLFAPHVAEDESGQLFYGYGWVVTKTRRGTNLVWHNGGWFGFYAEMRRYLDEDIVVIFLTNQPGAKAEQTEEKLLQILFA